MNKYRIIAHQAFLNLMKYVVTTVKIFIHRWDWSWSPFHLAIFVICWHRELEGRWPRELAVLLWSAVLSFLPFPRALAPWSQYHILDAPHPPTTLGLTGLRRIWHVREELVSLWWSEIFKLYFCLKHADEVNITLYYVCLQDYEELVISYYSNTGWVCKIVYCFVVILLLLFL